MTSRIDFGIALLTHSQRGQRETNGLYFAELSSLPRTILISRLPIKFLRRRPSEVTKLYGPLLIFMARK